MTEKRYQWYIDGVDIWDNQKEERIEDTPTLLNELSKENYQLKQFHKKVFELIDIKIKHYSHKPTSAPVGQPMSVNFDADVDRLARLSELQQLKKEVQE